MSDLCVGPSPLSLEFTQKGVAGISGAVLRSLNARNIRLYSPRLCVSSEAGGESSLEF
jgi:hypothetical protein